MAKYRGLKRLYRLRVLEEELSRLPLEAALGEQSRTIQSIATADVRQAEGRRSYVAGVERGDCLERAGGQMTMQFADRIRQDLLPQLDETNTEVARQQQEFLLRRTDRKQVEALLDTARMEAVRQEVTRTQQMLDDWYGRNAHERRSRRKRTMATDTSEAGKPRR